MRGIYRGVSYTFESQSIATIETEISAKFRGSTYRIRRPIDPPIFPLQNLMYRGVAYYPQSEQVGEVSPAFG
jgi:Domain of unknown function (DUF4278)